MAVLLCLLVVGGLFFFVHPVLGENSDLNNEISDVNAGTFLGALGKGFLNILIQFITWVALIFARVCIGLTIAFLRIFMQLAAYNNYIDSPVVVTGWYLVRDVANMFFVVALLAIAFGTIFGLEQYEWKKSLVKLVLAAIFINFSRLLLGLVIDASHIFTITFLDAVSGTAGGNLIQMLQIDKMRELAVGTNASDAIFQDDLQLDLLGAAALSVVFSLIAMLTVGAYLVVMALRIVILWVLIIVSPLAFVLSAIPATKQYAEEFWSELVKYIIVAPIMVFFLWLAFATLGSGNISNHLGVASGGIASDDVTGLLNLSKDPPKVSLLEISTWENMSSFIITIIFLLVGLERVQKVGTAGGSMVSGVVDFGKSAIKVASGYAAGRWAVGMAGKGAKHVAYKAPLIGGERWEQRAKAIGGFAGLQLQKFQGWRNDQAKSLGDGAKAMRDLKGSYERGEMSTEYGRNQLENLDVEHAKGKMSAEDYTRQRQAILEKDYAQAKENAKEKHGGALKRFAGYVGELLVETGGRKGKKAENWWDAYEAEKERVDRDYNTSSFAGGRAKYEARTRQEFYETLGEAKGKRRMEQYRRAMFERTKPMAQDYTQATEEEHHAKEEVARLDKAREVSETDYETAEQKVTTLKTEVEIAGKDPTLTRKAEAQKALAELNVSIDFEQKQTAFNQVSAQLQALGAKKQAAEVEKARLQGVMGDASASPKDKNEAQEKLAKVDGVLNNLNTSIPGKQTEQQTAQTELQTAQSARDADTGYLSKKQALENATTVAQTAENNLTAKSNELRAEMEKLSQITTPERKQEAAGHLAAATEKMKTAEAATNVRGPFGVAYQMVKVQQEEHFRTLQKERAEKELEQLFLGTKRGHEWHEQADMAEQGKLAAEEFIKELKNKSLTKAFTKAADEMGKTLKEAMKAGGTDIKEKMEEAARKNVFIRALRNSTFAKTSEEAKAFQQKTAEENAAAGFYDIPRFGKATISTAMQAMIAQRDKDFAGLESREGAAQAAAGVARILRKRRTEGEIDVHDQAALYSSIAYITKQAWTDDTIGEISALFSDLDAGKLTGDRKADVEGMKDIFVNQLGLIKRAADGKYKSVSNAENAAALQGLVAMGGDINMVRAHKKIAEVKDQLSSNKLSNENQTLIQNLSLTKDSSYEEVAKALLDNNKIFDQSGQALVSSYEAFSDAIDTMQQFLQEGSTAFKRAALDAKHMQNGGHLGFDRESGRYRLMTKLEAAQLMKSEAAKRSGMESLQFHSLGTVDNELGRLVKVEEEFMRSYLSGVTSAVAARSMLQRTVDQMVGYGTGEERKANDNGQTLIGGELEDIKKVFGSTQNFVRDNIMPMIRGQSEAFKYAVSRKGNVSTMDADAGIFKGAIKLENGQTVAGDTYSEFLQSLLQQETQLGLSDADKKAINDAIAVSRQKESRLRLDRKTGTRSAPSATEDVQ